MRGGGGGGGGGLTGNYPPGKFLRTLIMEGKNEDDEGSKRRGVHSLVIQMFHSRSVQFWLCSQNSKLGIISFNG